MSESVHTRQHLPSCAGKSAVPPDQGPKAFWRRPQIAQPKCPHSKMQLVPEVVSLLERDGGRMVNPMRLGVRAENRNMLDDRGDGQCQYGLTACLLGLAILTATGKGDSSVVVVKLAKIERRCVVWRRSENC